MSEAMSGQNMSMTEAIRIALGEVLEARPEAVMLGTDIGVYGGPFRASAGLHERFGADRVLDTPPNPAAILGFARGLKIAGHFPICELPPELAARGAGALIDGLSRFEARTGEAGGPMLVRIPVGLVPNGTLADGDSPEAALGNVPGLRVVSPSRPTDAWAMIRAAADSREPVVMLEPKALYRQVGLAPVEGGGDASVLHTARRVREGSDLVLIAWGAAVPVAVEAAERLTADGYEVGVIDLRVLAPLDVGAITEAVQATGRAIVVHDCGGAFAGEVARVATEASFLWLEAPIALVSHLQHAPLEAPSRADREDWVIRVRKAALSTIGF